MPFFNRYHLLAALLFCTTMSAVAQDLQIAPRDGMNGFEIDGKALSVTSTATGDFDKDGIDDIALGMSAAQMGSGIRPAVHIVYGSGPGSLPPLVTIPSGDVRSRTIYDSGGSGALFYLVASAGDVNNDGFDDLLIDDNPNRFKRSIDESENTTYLLYGSHDYLVDDLEVLKYIGKAAEFIRPDKTSAFKKTISGAGDMNGDGFDDIAIAYPDAVASLAYHPSQGGSPVCCNPGNGIVYILFGRAQSFGYGFSLDPDTLDGFDGRYIISTGFQEFYLGMGEALAPIGDWNGDGYDDLAVGNPHSGAENVEFNTNGMVTVFYGKPEMKRPTRGDSASYRAEWPEPGVIVISSLEQGTEFGSSLAGPGDVNGDGLPDLLIGARGSAYVIFGNDPDDPGDCAKLNPEDWEARVPMETLSEDGCGYKIVALHENPETYVIAASDKGDLNGDALTDVAVRFRTPGSEESNTVGAVIFGEPVTGRYIESSLSDPVYVDSMIGYTGRLLTLPYSFSHPYGGQAMGWTGDFNSDSEDGLTIGLPIGSPGLSEANVIYE